MSIPYSPLTWVNGSTPALNAANLQRFETALTTLCAGGSGSGLAADTVDGAHLSTNGSLGTSDTLVPSEKAVKLYADTKAPIASPTLTGTPAAPTAAAATDTTQIATTAFVHDAIALDTDYLTDFRAWDSTRTYTLDEPTFRNGIPYRSIIASNTNKDPELFPEAWEVVGGSGEVTSGVVNFLQNDLTANTLANVTSNGLTSLAWDLTATDILNVGALKAVAPASGTGRYIDIALSDLDPVDVGRTWSVEFSYKLGTNADDLVALYLYNGSVETPLSLGNLPYAGGTLSTAVATVIPTTTLTGQYLRFKFKDNAAATFYVAKVTVGPQSVAIGAAIGNWVSYTPTVLGAGTVTVNYAHWRREGDSIRISASYTTGVNSALNTLSIPSGLTIDVAKMPLINSNYYGAGAATILPTGVGTAVLPAVVSATASVLVITAISGGAAIGGGAGAIPSSANITFNVTVPISQWTSNVNLTSDFQEFAYNTSSTDADDLVSFGYGQEGSLIPNITGTSGKTKRVKFQRPIQSTDNLILEVYDPTYKKWLNFINRVAPYARNGVVEYGNRLFIIDDYSVNVMFGGGGYESSGGSFAATGSQWSTLYAAGWKWRVRKISNGNMAEVPPTVRAEYTSANSVVPGATSLVQFNTKVEDTHNCVTTGANWKFTAPIDGIYHVDAYGIASVASTTTGWINTFIYKTGAMTYMIGRSPIFASSCGADFVGSGTIRLKAGDYIHLAVGAAGNTNGNFADRRILITRIGN
ncbi:MAG TPA: hypothetical protein VLH56_18835 [Dissulfurispiraceae bacterium]|nr:hypothetical protein [Dissulfurispiraceae bacterium]